MFKVTRCDRFTVSAIPEALPPLYTGQQTLNHSLIMYLVYNKMVNVILFNSIVESLYLELTKSKQ